MFQQANSKRIKLCSQCEKKGISSKLKLHQLNFVEAIYLCTNRECIFPLDSALADSYIVKRTVNGVQRSVSTASAADEPSTDRTTDAYSELVESLDIAATDQHDRPSTSESSNELFDLDSWLEGIVSDDGAPCNQTQAEHIGTVSDGVPNEHTMDSIINSLDSVADHAEIPTEVIVDLGDKSAKFLVRARYETAVIPTEEVAITAQQFSSSVTQNTLEKPLRPPLRSSKATYSRNCATERVAQESVIIAEGFRKESPPRVVKPKRAFKRKVEVPAAESIDKIMGNSSMSLRQIISSVSVKKRPMFVLDGPVAERQRPKSLQKPHPTVCGVVNLFAGSTFSKKCGKRASVGLKTQSSPSSDLVVSEVPRWLQKNFTKFGIVTYAGYKMPKIRPEDETASEDSGIQSPNSFASAGSESR